MRWDVPTYTGLGDRMLDIWAVATVSRIKNEFKNEIHVYKTAIAKEHHQKEYFKSVTVPNCKIKEDIVRKLKAKDFIKHKHFNFMQSILMSGTTTPHVIHSHFPEKSFEKIRKIFQDIASHTQIHESNCEWARKYVAIHVRRGDKLKPNGVDVPPWEMNHEYAERLHHEVIKFINLNHPDDDILISGDDIEYMNCLQNILPNNVYIQRGSPNEDMKVLSECKVIIQAGIYSTFSIVAALLGQKPLVNFNDVLQGPKCSWDWYCVVKDGRSKINSIVYKRMDSIENEGNVDYTQNEVNMESVESKKKYALVVARYKEDLGWLYIFARKPEWDIHVYNDGPPLDPHLASYLTVHQGDKVPAEASKYLRFICDNYDTMRDKYKRIVFAQGNPFDHSPDFLDILENIGSINKPFQGLSFGYLPDPWGMETTRNTDTSNYIGNYRVWCEKMNDDFTPENWEEDYSIAVLKPSIVNTGLPYKNAFGASNFCSHYGVEKGTMQKWYAALFSATPECLHKNSFQSWKKMHKHSKININYKIEFWKKGRKVKVDFNSGKQYAILMEYMWNVLLTSE